ncbi:MAG: hypothetical protein LLG04_03155 [Parachlamydia sp.]|nr:hypothetical protein [Parachlamydia sp.]
MEPIVLKNESLQAIFDPDRGMNLLSYKRGAIEVIDPLTHSLFEERYAGLGALIGPHFHHRHVIPPVKDEALFPHIARVKAQGIQEPFSHGIARYAPWKAEATATKVTARLTGKDTWNGVALSALEGQNFTMEMTAELTPAGLEIALSVVSDADSLVGIHYYYHLPEGRGSVTSAVHSHYLENGERKPLPEKWQLDPQHQLTLDLNEAYDVTFHPFPNHLEGKIVLDAIRYRLVTRYTCQSQENSWQLYHPAGASFVCIEPISSQDPHHPNLTVSGIQIKLEIQEIK